MELEEFNNGELIFLDGELLLSPIHNDISTSNIVIVTAEKNKSKIINTSIQMDISIRYYKKDFWSYLLSYLWLYRIDKKFNYFKANKESFEEAVLIFLTGYLKKIIKAFKNTMYESVNTTLVDDIDKEDASYDEYKDIYSSNRKDIEHVLMLGVDTIQDLYSDNMRILERADIKGIFVHLFIDPVFDIKRNKYEKEKLTNTTLTELSVLEQDIKDKVFNDKTIKNKTLDIVKQSIAHKETFFKYYT